MAKGKLTLEAINQRLRQSNTGVVVRQKGKRLYLRATLPAKPGSGRIQPYQQDLALKIYANPAGLERAEAEAKKLGGLLGCKDFDWGLYLSEGEDNPHRLTTIEQWVEKFKKHYLSTHELSEDTWRYHWASIYGRLPQDAKLSDSLLVAVVLNTKPNTRNRRQTCEKLQKLANFAGIDFDLKQYSGNYSSAKTQPRDLPDDQTIAEWYERIPTETWKWFYGITATFGLRPHEAFFCSFEDETNPSSLQVLEGKTGPRVVRALYPEWVKHWGLHTIRKPNVSGQTYRDYGSGACKQFKRYGVPFSPYDLRHAFAVRASVVFEFPVAVAANLMGHSPAVHWQTYNRWISEDQHQRVYEKAMQKENRPQPPALVSQSP